MLDEKNILIRCDGLVKIYQSEDIEVMALQGLDLQVERGEMLAIIGKSGSGKSTLMNMLGGLEQPTAGKLFVNGEDLFFKNEQEMTRYRKEQVGFVRQMSTRNLLPYLTAAENIEVLLDGKGKSRKQVREQALDLLEQVGILHKKDAYPGQMSGGEQQRAAIAAALANGPEILLADEPTGAVDTKTSGEIFDLFRRLNEELGLTILIVTHDMKLAGRVNRVLMISDGKISTEKIMREDYRRALEALETESSLGQRTHEEYSVLDQAGRLQLNEEILSQAGIDSRRVKVEVVDGKVVITKE